MWEKRFRTLIWLGIPALCGLAVLLGMMVSTFEDRTPSVAIAVVGALLFIPGAVYLNLLVFWHWKARYQGHHSDLWGALLILETSGWFKLVYLFRHLIPDMRGSGRYVRTLAGDLPQPPP
jgi:hypothetical protein